jgi:predicted phage terminase large subunit-like protein
MIMQRLHQEDPTGYWLDKRKRGVKQICLPGEIRNGYDKFVKPPELRKHYIDDLLDANRLGWEELEDLEAELGQYGYSGQVGQNPTPPEGGMFKPERMPIVERLSSETNIMATVRYWDKAGTQDGGKRTAGVKMSKLSNGKYVVWDVVKGHWSTENREAVIKATSEADAAERPTRIGIEQEGGSGGKESAESTIMNLAGLAVHADRPTGDKAFRADPFSVQVNNGNVILIKGDWNADFKDEMRMFPVGTYLDQVDAGAGAFNMLKGKRQVRNLRKSRS